MDEMPPPWVALPDLDPDEPATHGMPEVYITLNWYPYWSTLSPEQKAAYLDRWNAPPRWREVIAECYDDRDDIDWEQEARENAEWRRAHGRDLPPRPWWRFWS